MDIYEKVTSTVIELLDRGVKPWSQPWSGGAGAIRPLRHNHQGYRGINVLILWTQAQVAGYTSAYWMTYKQTLELGGQVRKGEHSTQVVYYGSMMKEDQEAADEGGQKRVRFLRTFNVFNADQIDRLPQPYYAKQERPGAIAKRIPELEAFVRATGADIRCGGGRAYYRIDQDYVQMPDFGAFRDAEQAYATLNHELTHWTRHPSRLDRDMGRKRWGDEGYAAEELVAELGAAFLGAELGLRPDHIEDHASYIGSWLTVLGNDRRFIFTAAAKAQEAADYLLACQEGAQAKVAGRVQ
jgi:antirestriction protein ArdC